MVAASQKNKRQSAIRECIGVYSAGPRHVAREEPVSLTQALIGNYAFGNRLRKSPEAPSTVRTHTDSRRRGAENEVPMEDEAKIAAGILTAAWFQKSTSKSANTLVNKYIEITKLIKEKEKEEMLKGIERHELDMKGVKSIRIDYILFVPHHDYPMTL